MDSELTRPSEPDESQSSRLSSVHASDMGLGSDSDSDNDSSNGGRSEATPQVEWLATGRQRRSTAGNRMKSMLANEEPDSDLELLFAEDENDQGFSDAGEHASDVQMDSSSDDDDDNHDDDLEGEKELDRQAKERRAAQRKRKAQEAIPAKFRKKVRIDTSASTPRSSVAPSTPQTMSNQPPPRKKKKSERASWLPSLADMPTRASSRQTTRLSKEQLHAQMEAREAKRLKQLAQMQKKAARLEALKKPPMTQEDRLREAALVEERNARSLNRWEEAERQREEERRAKLAALQQRTLRGPVLSFWSGAGLFGDGWRKGEGVHVAVEEKPKKPKRERGGAKGKKKDDPKEVVKEETAVGTNPVTSEDASTTKPQSAGEGNAEKAAQNGEAKMGETSKQDTAADELSKDTIKLDAPDAPTQALTKTTTPAAITTAPTVDSVTDNKPTHDTAPKPAEDVSMTDVPTINKETAAVTEEETQVSTTNSKATGAKPSSETQTAETAKVPPTETKESESPTQPKAGISDSKDAKAEVPATTAASGGTVPPEPVTKDVQPQPDFKPEGANASPVTTNSNAPVTTEGEKLPTTAQPAGNEPLPASKIVSRIQSEAAAPQPDQARSPLDGLSTTRDAIIYQNFDGNAIKDRSIQTQVLFGHKMSRLSKPTPAPVCLITNNAARYRDPKTNLHFHSAAAFKELQRLQSGEYRWSRLLGAWAGSGAYAARGVPERFLNPARCPTLEEVQRIERKREEREKARLQRAEDEKKAKEEKKAATADTKQAARDGSAAGTADGGGGGGAITKEEGKLVVSVKTEDVAGTKTQVPSVSA